MYMHGDKIPQDYACTCMVLPCSLLAPSVSPAFKFTIATAVQKSRDYIVHRINHRLGRGIDRS